MTDIKVLVVEDEDVLRDQMVRKLISENLTAKGVKEGAAALILLEQEDFEVILLGGQTSQTLSIETLKLIKGGHPATQVIILAESSSVAFGIEAMKAGAFDFVLKPAPMGELLDKIQQAGERRTPDSGGLP